MNLFRLSLNFGRKAFTSYNLWVGLKELEQTKASIVAAVVVVVVVPTMIKLFLHALRTDKFLD